MTKKIDEICLLDTNILVAMALPGSDKNGVVSDFLETYKDTIRKFVISSQNILELTSVLSNAFKLNCDSYLSFVDNLIADEKIELIFPDHFSLQKYLGFLKKYPQIHTSDLFLVSTMLSKSISTIITLDNDFTKISELTVVNPNEN